MRAHKQQKFRAILLVRAATQQVAEDRNLIEKPELGAVGGMLGLLQPGEHDHLAVAHVHKGGGLAMADDGLGVGVDKDFAHLVVDLLVDFQLDAPVVTNQRGDLHVDADILVRNNRAVVAVDRAGRARARGRARDDGQLLADDEFGLFVMGGDDRIGREHLDVAFGARVAESGLEGEGVDHSARYIPAGDAVGSAAGVKIRDVGAVDGVGADREVESINATGALVRQRDLRNHHLDADLGEQDVDLVDDFADEADVVNGARDNDGVAAVIGQDGEQAAEIGTGTGIGQDVGDRRLEPDGQLRDVGGAGLGTRGVGELPRPGSLLLGPAGGLVPAGDHVGKEGGDVLGGSVFQVNDLVARVGVGLDIELGDQLVEEGVLARIGDDDDLVRAVVRAQAGGRADLVAQRRLENGGDLVDQVAGFGEVQGVELRLDAGGDGLVELANELLNALERADRVSDEHGVRFFEQDRSAEVRVEQGRDLVLQFVDAQEGEGKKLGGNAARGGEAQRRAVDHFGRLSARQPDRHHLQKLVAERVDCDAAQIEHGFNREHRFTLRHRRQGDRVTFRRGQGLGPDDAAAGPFLQLEQDGLEGLAAHLDRADHRLGGGGRRRQRSKHHSGYGRR